MANAVEPQETSRSDFPTSPWLSPVERDLGFGSVVAGDTRIRLLNRDGTFNVRREGTGFWQSMGLYHWLLQLSWPRFFSLVVATYLAVNFLFALGYLLAGPESLIGPVPLGVFGRAFFFSVETFGTIGY